MCGPMLGLIAGQGTLPVMVAQGMRAAGHRVCGVGLRDHFEAELPGLCDAFAVAGVYRLGRWISLLRRHGVGQAVIAGRVAKTRMHDPLRVVRQVPDWRAARLWYRRLRRDRRSATLLSALADELAACGIELIDSTRYVCEHLAGEGVLSRRSPSDAEVADIARGWPVLERLAALDIGQAVAVAGGEVVACEALEGTDAMIERAGRLQRRPWTLLKAANDDHDRRFDVPAIGPQTIERLARAGARCCGLRAGGVIMLDRPGTLEAADEAGIAVVGITVPG